MSRFHERFSKINKLNAQIKPLRLTPYSWDILYRNEAVKCFNQHLPFSCIGMSSALVETCLCWEHFMRKISRIPMAKRKDIESDEFRRDNLGSLFNEYIDSEIPLEKLLDADENIADLRELGENERRKKIGLIKYIVTRNKFVHGDLFYPMQELPTLLPSDEQELQDYGIDKDEWWNMARMKWSEGAPFETVAYVHLSKTLRFMQAFTELLIQKGRNQYVRIREGNNV